MLTITWHTVLWMFLDNYWISHQKFRASAVVADKSLFCDGEDGADSVGTGGASIPNYLHLPPSDLLIAGSFSLDSFRQTPEICLASSTGIERWRRKTKPTLLVCIWSGCLLVICCLVRQELDAWWGLHFYSSILNCSVDPLPKVSLEIFACCLYAQLLTSFIAFSKEKFLLKDVKKFYRFRVLYDIININLTSTKIG